MIQSWHLTSLVGSAAPVQVRPEWDGYEERRIPHRGQQRTETGVAHIADLGTYLAYTIPLAMVNSAQAFELNGWANDRREVALTISLSDSPHTVTCRIENDRTPFGSFERPRRDLYRGTLFLRESRGTTEPYSGGVFITDDAVWGLTDQTYNVTP